MRMSVVCCHKTTLTVYTTQQHIQHTDCPNMAQKIKEGLKELVQGVSDAFSREKQYAPNLLGESLAEQLRRATAKELAEPNEELNAQVGGAVWCRWWCRSRTIGLTAPAVRGTAGPLVSLLRPCKGHWTRQRGVQDQNPGCSRKQLDWCQPLRSSEHA